MHTFFLYQNFKWGKGSTIEEAQKNCEGYRKSQKCTLEIYTLKDGVSMDEVSYSDYGNNSYSPIKFRGLPLRLVDVKL